MTDHSKKNEFDPEKHKEVKDGPLKPEHKNQYGETSDGKDRNLSKRAKKEEEEKKNKS